MVSVCVVRVVDVFDRSHSFAQWSGTDSAMPLSTLLLSSAGVCCTKTEPTLQMQQRTCKTQTYSFMSGPLCCFSLLDYETNLKYRLSFQCLTITTPLYSKVSSTLKRMLPLSLSVELEMAMYKSEHAVSDHHKIYEQVLSKIQ